MDTFCRKYSEPVPKEKAECGHPKDYCKFRTSCIVHFLSQEFEDGPPENAEAADDPEVS